MSDLSPDVPLTGAPEDGQAFGHFLVPRRTDGSLWKLGEGNMGVTYRAFDTSLRVEVALKVINAARVNEDEARRRFQREARAAAKIRHPNVASVLYLGEEGGEFFYAMEFIPGSSLDRLLKDSAGPLPPLVAVAFAAQVAAALNAAHRREVVHRDLKPTNLMFLDAEHLDQEDARTEAAGHRQIKVIDFGLARSFSAERQDESLVTQTVSGFVGTPMYASPEQAAGEGDIDGRSDLYSLGVILWQMLAGSPPFTGKVVEVMRKHLFTPPPMEQLPAGLPEYLLQVISGLLAKEPAQRWPQNAGDLRNALDACLYDLVTGEVAPDAPAGDAPVASIRDGAVDTTTPTEAVPLSGHHPVIPLTPLAGGNTVLFTKPKAPGHRLRKPMLIAAGAAVLLAGLAFAGWRLVASRSRSSAVPSTSNLSWVDTKPGEQKISVPTTGPGSSPATNAAAESQNQYAALPGPTPAPAARLPGGVSGDALEQARALRQRGDMRAALSRLREALVAEPDNPQAVAELALTYESMQLADKAAEQWQRIFAMGESVGALYYLADTKLHSTGKTPAPPDTHRPGNITQEDKTVLKITSINVEEVPDPSVEQKVALKVIVKGMPGVVINPNLVKIEVYFYDLVDGKEMAQTDAQTDFVWLTPQPINWANDKSEVLEALYVRPKDNALFQKNNRTQRRDSINPAADASGAPVRKYLGYSVRVYHNGQLQEVQADPVRLLERFQAPLTLSPP